MPEWRRSGRPTTVQLVNQNLSSTGKSPGCLVLNLASSTFQAIRGAIAECHLHEQLVARRMLHHGWRHRQTRRRIHRAFHYRHNGTMCRSCVQRVQKLQSVRVRASGTIAETRQPSRVCSLPGSSVLVSNLACGLTVCREAGCIMSIQP